MIHGLVLSRVETTERQHREVIGSTRPRLRMINVSYTGGNVNGTIRGSIALNLEVSVYSDSLIS